MGMSVMLDVIINYVQSLQNQIEVNFVVSCRIKMINSRLQKQFFKILCYLFVSFSQWSFQQQACSMTSTPRKWMLWRLWRYDLTLVADNYFVMMLKNDTKRYIKVCISKFHKLLILYTELSNSKLDISKLIKKQF